MKLHSGPETKHLLTRRVPTVVSVLVFGATVPEGELTVGFEVKNDRLFFHQDLVGHMIIPNHLEDARHDGFVTAWNFYAKLPGNITLIVSSATHAYGKCTLARAQHKLVHASFNWYICSAKWRSPRFLGCHLMSKR